MAPKFIELKEAAQMIGVSPEELIDMRTKGTIFGYRDGTSWKFKMDEVERILADRGSQIRGDSAILSADDDDFENLITGLSSKIQAEKNADSSEDADSILVSEEELGQSSTGKSTIIGKGGLKKPGAADSDLKLTSDSSGSVSGIGSGKLLEAPANKLNPTKNKSDVLTGSGLQLAVGSGTGEMPGIKPGSGTGDMPRAASKGGSSLELGDELQMADDAIDLLGGSNINQGSKGQSGSGSGAGSIDLDDGDDLVLSAASGINLDSGSGSHKDVTSGAGDSGINLGPSDSGINLEEEPLDLGGSAVDQLSLPDDDGVIALSDDSLGDPDDATQLKADDQFMLSPSDSLVEDESDSGSQVIALEDSSSFDENAATMLNKGPEDPFATATAMPDAMFGAEMGAGAVGQMGQMGGPAAYLPMPAQETPYSLANVLLLMATFSVLAVAGMFMVDVMLNMWSFDKPGSISTGMMETVITTFGMNPKP